jgi:hypothetical protein
VARNTRRSTSEPEGAAILHAAGPRHVL